MHKRTLSLKTSFFIYLGSFSCLAFPVTPVEKKVREILHASNLKKLQTHIKKHQALSFKKALCEKQIQLKIIPYACYSFSELKTAAKDQCQELDIKNVTLLSLKKALSNPLPKSCRKNLKTFEKILIYRKKDAFLKPFHP